MAPILLAFVIGSLPLLLPIMIYHKLVRRPQKQAEPLESQATAPVASETRTPKPQNPARNARPSNASPVMAANFADGVGDPA